MPTEPASWLRATLSGLCATLVGIGLARFAYTPLIPALIEARWFTPAQAAYLGAANLAGYLAGAVLGRGIATVAPRAILRLMMSAAAGTFFACAFPLSFWWVFAWRAVAGLSGGLLMVLAAPTVLPGVPVARRGLASGAIFMGVGLGVAASGTLVPLLLRWGVGSAWLGLGTLGTVLTLAAWSGWPRGERAAERPSLPRAPHTPGGVGALYVEYALNGAGLVPHMVFLVDFIARGLGQGLEVGARYWVLYGIGAAVGPMLSGHLADRIGFRRALRIAQIVQILSVGLPALSEGPVALAVSSFVVGACTPGIVPIVFGRILELVPAETAQVRRAWSIATTGYALFQAAAAYGFSFLFARSGGGYAAMFALGSAALAAALAIDLRSGRARRP